MEFGPHNLTSTLSLLDLHSNKLGGKMPPLPPFATLVDYSRNKFNSCIPDDIGSSLSGAIFFSMSDNNFQGNIPESICQARYLQVLHLSDNSFTGIIPPCIANASLMVLNLRNNNLSGYIPEGFPRTCGLKTLDLSQNQLQGSIPLSLSNCTKLEVLNIGNNQMNGSFPCHLKNKMDLRVLVMRGNKFSGQIGCPENHAIWNLLQIVDLANNAFSKMPPEDCLHNWKAMQANNDINRLQQKYLGLTGLFYEDCEDSHSFHFH
ncbi:hypothetical protein SAY87_014788 [Trapa incisa]|uniref:Uncharacterized protein n=1 Tax=Trapa incisa TaxID=236973 RepID=A0AAN7GWN7_9MYRT|nr:hypothetical protein SAY87_014788 [Trapa incisa]